MQALWPYRKPDKNREQRGRTGEAGRRDGETEPGEKKKKTEETNEQETEREGTENKLRRTRGKRRIV